MTRRGFAWAALAAGCSRGPAEQPDLVWGRRGVTAGDLVKPRAAAIDGDTIYLVDFTARIQAYDLDGNYRGVTWQTPDFRNGRPSGLSIGSGGRVIVADSHYHAVRIYDPAGRELKTLGGEAGSELGQFGYVSDCVEDADGSCFVSEFGANERITKLDPDGKPIGAWGEPGSGPRQFSHIRALALHGELLYVADACNHRIQIYDRAGRWQGDLGRHGADPGQFTYPYDVAIGPRGDIYVVELGNHRVQKFNPKGEPVAVWGGPGRAPGRLFNPWALAVDRSDRVHVVDSENHRVQRIRL
jgi:DNA-binding beta-propeller fold protein YncE